MMEDLAEVQAEYTAGFLKTLICSLIRFFISKASDKEALEAELRWRYPELRWCEIVPEFAPEKEGME